MTTTEILKLVSEVLGVPVEQFTKHKAKPHINEARYIAYMIMVEEGINKYEVLKVLGDLKRESFYYIQYRIDRKLSPKGDKKFKLKYLSCIARMAKIEQENEENQTKANCYRNAGITMLSDRLRIA